MSLFRKKSDSDDQLPFDTSPDQIPFDNPADLADPAVPGIGSAGSDGEYAEYGDVGEVSKYDGYAEPARTKPLRADRPEASYESPRQAKEARTRKGIFSKARSALIRTVVNALVMVALELEWPSWVFGDVGWGLAYTTFKYSPSLLVLVLCCFLIYSEVICFFSAQKVKRLSRSHGCDTRTQVIITQVLAVLVIISAIVTLSGGFRYCMLRILDTSLPIFPLGSHIPIDMPLYRAYA